MVITGGQQQNLLLAMAKAAVADYHGKKDVKQRRKWMPQMGNLPFFSTDQKANFIFFY